MSNNEISIKDKNYSTEIPPKISIVNSNLDKSSSESFNKILDDFLKNDINISICTLNNKELRGKLINHDKDILVLETNNSKKLYCMKNAISYFQIMDYSNCPSNNFFSIQEEATNYLDKDFFIEVKKDEKDKENTDMFDFSSHLYFG